MLYDMLAHYQFKNYKSFISLIFFLGFSIVYTLAPVTHAKGWKIQRKKSGIVVSQREEKGRDLPSFKGTGVVKANMYEILAILRDGKRRREWMSKSGVTRVLNRKSIFEAVSYQQTLAPWPVSDREVVMHTKVFLDSKKNRLIATFNHVKWNKKMKGVNRDDFVLMPYLKGYWLLQSIDENKTEVTYMVNTDPGGILPNWLIKKITSDLPLYTLQGLRKQAKRSKNRYQNFLNTYDPSRTATPKVIPPSPPVSVLRYIK